MHEPPLEPPENEADDAYENALDTIACGNFDDLSARTLELIGAMVLERLEEDSEFAAQFRQAVLQPQDDEYLSVEDEDLFD